MPIASSKEAAKDVLISSLDNRHRADDVWNEVSESAIEVFDSLDTGDETDENDNDSVDVDP